jgi:glycosyltransferase involved in cell wall biosynthesis
MAIVTDVGGNTELVEDGITGFVAASPSVQAVDDALERAWEAREAWREMGIGAGRKVREEIIEHPVENFIQRLLLENS